MIAMFRWFGLLWAAAVLNAQTSAPTTHPIEVGNWRNRPTIDNFAGGEIVDYPVILLRGHTEGVESDHVTVTAEDASGSLRTFVVVQHPKVSDCLGFPPQIWSSYKCLVELSLGKNTIRVRNQSGAKTIDVTYRPIVDRPLLRVVYVVAADGDTTYETPHADDPQDYRGKIATAMKLLQSFTAETMNDLGFGRKTFGFDRDEAGEPIVDLLRGPLSADEYRKMDGMQLWRHVDGQRHRSATLRDRKTIAIMAFARLDPATGKARAHTALGGGDLALFSSVGMSTWPSTIAGTAAAFSDERRIAPTVTDDSAYRGRNWAMASTTLGAVLHETGHALGLPHTVGRFTIMSRGFDHLNRFFLLEEDRRLFQAATEDPKRHEEATFGDAAAKMLAISPYFVDRSKVTGGVRSPTIDVDFAQCRLAVKADGGLGYIAFKTGDDLAQTDFFDDAGAVEKTYDLAEVWARCNAAPSIVAVDRVGRQTVIECTDIADPQHFCAKLHMMRSTRTTPRDRDFLDLDPSALADVRRRLDLADDAATWSYRPYRYVVDIGTAAEPPIVYAKVKLRAEDHWNVLLRTAIDGSCRIWVDGRLVASKKDAAERMIDDLETPLTLNMGEHEILFEISRPKENPKLTMRLTTPDGRPLRITDDGVITYYGSLPK